MTVDDQGSDVVEGDLACFLSIPADGHEPPVDGKMHPVGGDFDDPADHSSGPESNNRPAGLTKTSRAPDLCMLAGDMVV